MKNTIKNHLGKFDYSKLILLLIFFLSIAYHVSTMDRFPQTCHAWAQCDHYAISLGFIENGFDFFHPKTYVMNKEFPSDWLTPYENSVTPVDFPFHQYVVGLLMSLFGTTAPWVFRSYVLLVSLVGLFFLYKLFLLVTERKYKSLVLMGLFVAGPAYVYYQNSFLPSIPTLSVTMIGIYYYFLYLRDDRRKHFIAGVALLTFATLTRLTFAVPLFAVACNEFLRFITCRKSFTKKIPVFLVSFAFVFGYWLYNNYLKVDNGSMFLGRLMTPYTWGHALNILNDVYKEHFYQYFTGSQYILMLFILLYSLLALVLKKTIGGKEKGFMLTYMGIYFLGCICFTALMFIQFVHHDYYFLDTFYLPIVLILGGLFALVPDDFIKLKWLRWIVGLGVTVLLIVVLIRPFHTQKVRRQHTWEVKTETALVNYKGSDEWLTSIGVSKDAKLLLIDFSAPNLPFILMNRHGYNTMTYKTKKLKRFLKWDYDYVVLQNCELFKIYTNLPSIVKHLKPVASNGRLIVCTYSKKPKNKSFTEFKKSIGSKVLFKTVPVKTKDSKQKDSNWRNVVFSGKKNGKDEYCGILKSTMEYGPTYTFKDLKNYPIKPTSLNVSAVLKMEELKECAFAVSIEQKGAPRFYKEVRFKEYIKKPNDFNLIDFWINLPEIKDPDAKISAYFRNPFKAQFVYYDLEIALH